MNRLMTSKDSIRHRLGALIAAGIVLTVAVAPAVAQPRHSSPLASRGGGPRERIAERDRSIDLSPERAREAYLRRLAELDAERARVVAALATLEAGGTLEQSGAELLAEDRLRLLRSWREQGERRIRRGPIVPPPGHGPPASPEVVPDFAPFHPEASEFVPTWRQGERPNPERIDALRRFVREGNPLLWAELERMRQSDPERYDRLLAEQARRFDGDEEGFEAAMRLDHADQELHLLGERLRFRGEPVGDAERAVLRARIAAAYEARMSMLGHRLRRMEERLQQARGEHMKMLESRETLIDQRLREIENELHAHGDAMESGRRKHDLREPGTDRVPDWTIRPDGRAAPPPRHERPRPRG